MENSDNDNESISSTSAVGRDDSDGTPGSSKMKVPLLTRKDVSSGENVRISGPQCDAIRDNAVQPREGRVTRSMTAKTAGNSVPKAVVKTKMTKVVKPKKAVVVREVLVHWDTAGFCKPCKFREGYRKPGRKAPPEVRI